MVRMSLLTTAAAAALFSLSTLSMAGDGQAPGASRAGGKTISNCNGASKVLVAQSTSGSSNATTTFADVAGSVVSFNTVATKCVIVSFSAQAFAVGSGHLMNVR